MNFADSSHIWHVAKSGSDSNGGKAQQYPVNLANDAKLTIQAAVNGACDGDTIVIWPGTYSESVDASAKKLHLCGTSRESCIIQIPGTAMWISSNSSMANLSVVVPVNISNAAMYINSKDNIVMENCYFETLREEQLGYGCLLFNNCRNIVIRDSYINASVYGIKATDSDLALKNCRVRSTARFTYQNAASLYFTSSAGKRDRQVLATGCKFILERGCSIPVLLSHEIVGVDQANKVFTVEGDASGQLSQADKICVVLSTGNDGQYTVSSAIYDGELEQTDVTVCESIPNGTADGRLGKSSTEPAHGVLCGGLGVFNSCVVYAGGGSYTASDVKGVTVAVGGRMLLDCCSIFTEENHASADSYDISNEGQILTAGSFYDIGKTSGAIVRGGVGIDKAVKLLINKACQNKVTGAIDYYDDDGETVILTHTPTDGAGEITRTPG